MSCEAGHLRQIAHRALWHIRLPVRIGGETGGRVPRQVRTHRCQMLRIPRKHCLKSLYGIRNEHAYCRKPEQGKSVLAPIHLLIRFHAGQPVNQPLAGTQHRVEPSAFTLEDAGQVDAHRANGKQQNDRVDSKLQPPIGSHVRISPRTAWR